MTVSTATSRSIKTCIAVAAVALLYVAARAPELAPEERARLVERFRFTSEPLPELAGSPPRTQRAVHPSYQRIAAWVSTVGAAVALADLDGDGLPNDSCHVDPRSDQVIVAPVPGSGARYEPFALVVPGSAAPSTTAPMGCVPADLNEDGFSDLLVYYWGRPPTAHLWRATALEVPAAGAYLAQDVAPASDAWYTNAVARADVDGDGHVDLIVGNYFPEDARVLDPMASNRGTMQASMSHALNGGRNRLLLWSSAQSGRAPRVAFTDASGALDAHSNSAWTLAVAAAPIDGELLPDVYFANDFAADLLLHNRSTPGNPSFAVLMGQRSFTTPKSKVLGRDSFKGMGVDFGDLTGDGRLDIAVSNIADDYALEESHFLWANTGAAAAMQAGLAPFEDRSEALGLARTGWGWDTRLADFDNDGGLELVQATGFTRGSVNRWPELHELAMANDVFVRFTESWPGLPPGADLSGDGRPFLFVRAANGHYYDVAPSVGLGAGQMTRGIAIADVDGDGLQDLALANQWSRSFFYRNRSTGSNAFLGLRLLLPAAGEPDVCTAVVAGRERLARRGIPAIGAVVRVLRENGAKQIGVVDGGSGHSGKRSPELLFGLGAGAGGKPVAVHVTWRDRYGKERVAELSVPPGWNTVWLGAASCEEGASSGR